MTRPTRRGFLAGVAGVSLATSLKPLGAQSVSRPPFWTPPSDEADWEQLREEFLPGRQTISLNSSNMSPAPREVVEAVREATRQVDMDVSYQSRARFGEALERARRRLATMVGAQPDEIAIVRNASEGNAIVVGGVELGAGDEVLLCEENHPSNNVAWAVRAARSGFSIRRVALPPDPASPDELFAKITGAVSDRTRVIAFSHVSNVSGLRIPAAAVGQWARARNIHTHVDGAQSFAATRLDLHAMQCDSFTASAQKWLLGPREIGFLYVHQERIDRVWPGVVSAGWGNRVTPAVEGARRFESMGQRNDAAIAGLEVALAFQERIGIDRIVARTAELAGRIAQGLTKLGLPMVTPSSDEARLAVMIIRAEQPVAQRWHERLYREFGVITSPTGGLRLSPSVAVTMADVERALEAVAVVTGRA